MTLRARLLIGLIATVAVGLVIVDVVTYTFVTNSMIDQVDAELQRAHPPIERAALENDQAAAIAEAAPGFYVDLRDENGAKLVEIPIRLPGDVEIRLGSTAIPSPGAGESDDQPSYASVSVDDGHHVRVRVSAQEDGATLVIGRAIDAVEHSRDRLLLVLIAGTLIVLAMVAAAGDRLVRIGLRPLTEVERTAAAITGSDLDSRVPGDDQPTEVGHVAAAINRMLDRLHQAFDQRERDLAEVQESEARMRRFVADASHELRTPIAATAAYAELIERGADRRPDDLARAVTGIRSETGRMASLVEDLLLLAEIDEHQPLQLADVDLTDVVVQAIDASRAIAPDRPIKLRVDEALVVTGDASRLRQVIDNLLTNVRVHTPPETACLVSVHRDGDSAVVTVTDHGPGMNADDLAHALDRFYRADRSRSRTTGGSGLGLSIVAAIVRAHDGDVDVASTPGTGTRVAISLPLTRP